MKLKYKNSKIARSICKYSEVFFLRAHQTNVFNTGKFVFRFLSVNSVNYLSINIIQAGCVCYSGLVNFANGQSLIDREDSKIQYANLNTF